MQWMRLAVTFPRDDRVQRLSRSERYLFIELILWSVEHGTAGRIPPSALRVVGDGHKGKARSLLHMAELGLLSVLDAAINREEVGLSYVISSFSKWQMVTDRPAIKPAGQSGGGELPSRAGTPAGTENRTDKNPPTPHRGIEDPEPTAPPVAPIGPLADKLTKVVATWSDNHGSKQNGSH